MSRILHLFTGLAFIFAAIAIGHAEASELQQGWYNQAETTDGPSNLKVLSNRGDQGGELALVCDKTTKRLNITYAFKGKKYDFFVIRNFGDISELSDTKLLVGGGTSTQADIYWHLLRDEHAFVVARFPIGSKSIWDTSVKAAVEGKAVKDPNILQEGDEFFIAGPQIKLMLNQVGKFCPFDGNDKQPLL